MNDWEELNILKQGLLDYAYIENEWNFMLVDEWITDFLEAFGEMLREIGIPITKIIWEME